MRQLLFKQHRKTRPVTDASTSALQMRGRGQSPKQLPRQLAPSFGQSRIQSRIIFLLVTLVMSVLDQSVLQALMPVGSILLIRLRQAVSWLKQWPRQRAAVLGQPHVQYRLMLLLAVLLVLLIGWSVSFSTMLHLPLVIGAGRVSKG